MWLAGHASPLGPHKNSPLAEPGCSSGWPARQGFSRRGRHMGTCTDQPVALSTQLGREGVTLTLVDEKDTDRVARRVGALHAHHAAGLALAAALQVLAGVPARARRAAARVQLVSVGAGLVAAEVGAR